MRVAGKTTFLKTLGAKVLPGSNNIEEYDSFTFNLDSGKKIYIGAGKDIGGHTTYINQYTKIIEKADVIFYFLDIEKYLNNYIDPIDGLHYRRDCNSRLDLINIHKDSKKVIIFATHKDKLMITESIAKSKFFDLMKDKKYSEMLEGIIFINLTNISETKSVINKIFN
ncbi:hypothetical protein K5I29_11070 [Flavobacterium agricola]|uniref:Uncharacterized protein n=1 Tax=Flavobacterium agricola TaxID=2870839 RepID=A0ABY6LXG4_9FLAO|nr:hypothetical protein [Flavobacterium agricola]UYW01024.1 hypothetical protein K5I29_11070 [Flavobacterium agricola]